MSKTNQQLNDVIAFWIFGLSNNFAYVIMLSAAEDIIQNEHGRNIAHNSTQQCIEDLGKPRCNELMSTGAILLADILPALCVKFTFPFFMNRIPFGFRHFVVCAFQAISYFIVAFSSSIEMSLVGVVFAAISSGLGEICFLALSSHYTKSSIAAWSSGTGGAGIIGAFLYAAMTEPKLIGLSPKTALLCMLIVPVIFAITYWLLLTPSPTVHKMHLLVPSTWIVPAEKTALISSLRKSLSKKSEPASSTTTAKEEDSHSEVGGHEVKVYPNGDGKQLNSVSSDHEEQQSEKRAFTHEFSFRTKMRLILPILRYMIPLSLVYFGEYLINSGLHQLLPFDCARSFHLQRESQFRWYQALYQFGVFISRTSIFFLVLPRPVLYSLPLFQAANLMLLYFQALDRFIPHIVIVFLLTFIEGIFGGASYVNTFHRIHKEVPPEVREFSMSIASTGDSVGITAAGFFSILLHNHICGLYPKIYP